MYQVIDLIVFNNLGHLISINPICLLSSFDLSETKPSALAANQNNLGCNTGPVSRTSMFQFRWNFITSRHFSRATDSYMRVRLKGSPVKAGKSDSKFRLRNGSARVWKLLFLIKTRWALLDVIWYFRLFFRSSHSDGFTVSCSKTYEFCSVT